jgi:hypothetical protein
MNHINVEAQSQVNADPILASGILQRKCACGSQTVGGGKCAACDEKEQSLQRKSRNIVQPHSSAIQRKVTIGASDDPLEREADRVADQVMAMPASGAITRAPLWIQRFTGRRSGQITEAPPSVDHALASSSKPLAPELRQDMEARFGYDFSNVRVHTGKAADKSAMEMNALAYTLGNNIVLRTDQFHPTTYAGRRLIAHELVHVVQQSTGYQVATEPYNNGGGWADLEATNVTSVHQAFGISNAPAPLLQREVGEEQVTSASEVIRKIRAAINEADSSLLGRAAAVGGDMLNLVRLFYLALDFQPGAVRDAPGNRFVYTCNGGWIDLGHFFLSALVAYLAGFDAALRAGHLMESPYQAFFYRIANFLDPEDLDPDIVGASGQIGPLAGPLAPSFSPGAIGPVMPLIMPQVQALIRGNARSYYTIEDLPTDLFGSRFGEEMREGAGPLTLATAQLIPTGPYDIAGAMESFFADKNAVIPDPDILRAMMEETIPNGLPRQHRYTTPYLLRSAAPLCSSTSAE